MPAIPQSNCTFRLTQKVQLDFCVAGINTLKPFVFNGIISMLCCNLHNLCCIKICRQRLQHSMFKGFQDKGFSGIKACFFRAKRTFGLTYSKDHICPKQLVWYCETLGIWYAFRCKTHG